MPLPARNRRSLPRVLAVVLFFLVLALMVAKPIATAYVRQKLQETLSSRLDGDLHLGPLSYSFPLGVHVGESKIVSKDPAGGEFEILGMDSFDLVLHEHPFRPGPLIIERIVIGHPTLHVIRTSEGYVGVQAAVRHQATDPGRPERKLSEIFELRHLKLESGQVQYEDRTREKVIPLIWKGLNIDLGTEPSSGAKYAFDLSALAGEVASLSAKGEFNIDSLDLKIDNSQLAVQANPGTAESAVPAAIQEQLQRYGIKGNLVIATTADVPLRDPRSATFDTKVTLKGASAQLPDNGVKLDDASFSIECQRGGESPVLAVTFSTAVRAAGATVSIEKGTASIDPAKQTFVLNQFDTVIDLGSGDQQSVPEKLEQIVKFLKPGGKVVVTLAASGPIAKPSFDTLTYDFAADVRGIAIKPPGFPEYLTGVNGIVRAHAGSITFENCSAMYGGDTLHVASAQMPVEQFDKFIHVKEITGDVVMRDPHPKYPDVLENIFVTVNPRGPIAVAGDVSVDQTTDKTKVDYNLRLSSDHAQLSPTKYNILMTDVKCDLAISPERITLSDFASDVFDGRLIASAEMLGKSPRTYQAQVTLRGAELANIIKTFNPDRPTDSKPQTGKCFLTAELSGSSDPPDVDPIGTMKGRGEFEIVDGNFAQSRVISGIVNESHLAADTVTVSQAGGIFDIADRKVVLKNMAVSAPVLGIQGSGTVAFDGQLNLKLVAAPLADWREQIKKTRIPIISDVAGEVFGAAQKVINGATKKILYEFHVTGQVGNPKIETIPAPALTKGAAKLFVGMAKASEKIDLMSMMKSSDKEQ